MIVRLPSQTSVAETPAKNSTSCGSSFGVPEWDVHSTVVSAGQTRTGGVVSWIVTFTVS